MRTARYFLLFLAVVGFQSRAFASEAEDRVAMERAIESLNVPKRVYPAVANPQAAFELDRLKRSHPGTMRILGPDSSAPSPAVVVSHEPWGEAQVNLSKLADPPVVFVTPDVALVNGSCRFEGPAGAVTETVPLVFVMKKENGEWKIASIRRTAVP